MPDSEADIQNAVRLAVGGLPNVRLWRNNVGVGVTPDGRRAIRFGLPGSSDMIGILQTNDGDGIFLGIEIKTSNGRQSLQQIRFESMVKKFGGCYVLARSKEDALNGINDFQKMRSLRQQLQREKEPRS